MSIHLKLQDVKENVAAEIRRISIHMGIKETAELAERIEHFNKYLEHERGHYARARKVVLSNPFPANLRVEYEAAMDRVDGLLAQLGHKQLPREKYR